MDRRDFLKTGSAAAASALIPEGLSQSSPAVDSGRIILPINRNWRYSPNNTEAAHGKDFDDSHFDQVVIPHSNSQAALAQLRRQRIRIHLHLQAPLQATAGSSWKARFCRF